MALTGKIHSIETFGTVDGPGIRYVIFLQGCPLRCKFCHNRDSWNIHDGKSITVEELIRDIKKYIPFMEASGGGVTISGGEPTLQLDFLISLVKEIKNLNLHICLDTSGFLTINNRVEELLQYIDLILLDVKHINKEKHKKLTGVDNEKILYFAKYLSNQCISMWIRHVVIPTITDDVEDIKALAEFILSLDTVKRVELLPYHSMGKYKWKNIEGRYPLEGIKDATETDITRFDNLLARYGLLISSFRRKAI